MLRPTRSLLAALLVLCAAPAGALRATDHLDGLEALLAERLAALAGAVEKAPRKQAKVAEKALARMDVPTSSLTDDLKLAKKVSGTIEKAFATDGEVILALEDAAGRFSDAAQADAAGLARARAGLPEAKPTRKADRLLRKAARLRDKAAQKTKPKRRLALLFKAQRAADKAAAALQQALGPPAPTRLVLSPRSALLTEPGEVVTIQAQVLDQLGRPMQAPVSFASTAPDVAAVSPAGDVSAGQVGSAQIVGSVGDLETAVVVVNARMAPGALPVADERVASLPEPVDDTAQYGVGFRYTVGLHGTPPQVGDLLVGTGEIPLGGRVVGATGAAPALVTLEILPLGELFAELVIDERLESGPENLEIPGDVLEDYHVEEGADGSYVFLAKDEAVPAGGAAPEARQARGAVQGTVASAVGPFDCSSDVSYPLGLNSPPTFSVTPSLSIDFQYDGGLRRLVATGGATLAASYKPRLQAAVTGKIACKARLFGMTVSVPGPIALLVGGYVPVGVGFEASGTVTIAQFGFDATFSDSFSVQVGVDCTAGPCEAVAGAPDPEAPASPPPPPFSWVFPNVLTDFNVALGVSAFGYFEIRIGNPLWETLQLKMVEGQAGVSQSANLAPTLTQLENPGSASDYKLTLFAKVGSGVSLRDVLDLFSVNVADFELKAELDVANSPSASSAPDGSLAFDGPVAAGDEVVARVILKDPTYLRLDNVEEVRFYRKSGPVLTLRGSVPGSAGAPLSGQAGLVEYAGTWTAESADLGAEFGVVVKTLVPVVEFEVEANSLRTLEGGTQGALVNVLGFTRSRIPPDPLDFLATDEDGPMLLLLDQAGGTSTQSSLDLDVEADGSGLTVDVAGAAVFGGAGFNGFEHSSQLRFEVTEEVPFRLTGDAAVLSAGGAVSIVQLGSSGQFFLASCPSSCPGPFDVSGVIPPGIHFLTGTSTTFGLGDGTSSYQATLRLGSHVGN